MVLAPMSHEDFDLEGLARYLHLTPAQVQRMADRGQVPGRKIGGQWRFSQADIHHWLEDRIGASDEDELVAVEDVLKRQHEGALEGTLDAMLPLEAIDPSLPAKTRGAVIDAMARLAGRTGLLWDPDKMAEAVRARETLHPTALDNGVALLHPRRPMASILAEPFLALGKTSGGIPFGGARGALTDVFFLISSVSDAGHLHTLARLSRLLSIDDFPSQLRAAVTNYEMKELVRSFEEKLTEK
jgi:PTS system nitrogen regulatory IIA component